MSPTTMDRYGPHQPCQRKVCATLPTHPGGRHLDPRDELYDGPEPLLKVLPWEVREQVRRLVAGVPPELVPDVIELAQHIEWQREQVAAVRVDGERREREAIARSADCEHHGQEIRGLREQLTAADKSYRSADAGRVALVAFLDAMEESVRVHRDGYRPDATAAQLIDVLDKATKKASAAHERAWRR